MENKFKNNKFLAVIIVIIFIGIVVFLARLPHKTSMNQEPTGLQTFTDEASGASFQYPANVSTTYVEAIDWPPQIQVVDAPFVCTEAGRATDQAGETKKETIDGKEYCVTRVMEGAAGSTYTLYAYGTEVDGKVVYYAFSFRTVQCDNYNEPEKSSCKTDQAAFDIEPTVVQIVNSTKL